MALEITNIDELDPELVAQAQAELTQMIAERHPEIELGRGVIHDIVAYMAGGVSGGANQTLINRVLQSRSLLAINENPELAEDELVDHVLSNFRTTRRIGTRATGTITLVVTGNASVVITASQPFLTAGYTFRADGSFVAKPPGSTAATPSERVLRDRGDNTYEFTIPVTAEEVGAEGNVRRNAVFVPEQPLDRLVNAFAAEDFVDGTSTETNTDLVSRLESGIAAPVMQGRKNIQGLVASTAAVADTKHLSIIGFGDPEMRRDQHWVWPVSGGGRVDIYARVTDTPKSVAMVKEATLVEKTDTGGTWQVVITRDEAPGFYEIAQIRRLQDPTDSGGFEIISDLRGFDISGTTHDIVDSQEATYTRYQTAIIRFFDGLTDYTAVQIGDTATYSVTASAMPRILELQALADDFDHVNLAGDVLIKAAVPCFVTINCTVLKSPSESAPDTGPIKTAIAKVVNDLDFPESIASSRVYDVIHNFLTTSSEVSALDMHGRIRMPSGEDRIIRDRHHLQIPDLPSQLTTGNTVAFILDSEDIGITVRNKGS